MSTDFTAAEESEIIGPPKLVVADDEEGLLFLMVDALRREGFAVEGFGTAKETIDWLARESADLLVLDLKLGELSAPQVIQRLRKHGREYPFIVVTGHGDERTAVDVMKQGALDYVMKESGMLDLLPGIVRRALSVVERDRKLAEANELIRKREERRQKIIHTALDGFVRFNARWRILEINGALCQLLQHTPEEMLQLSLEEIDAAASREQLADRLAQLDDDGFAHFFTRLRRKDGRLLDVELSLRADQNEYFGFVHDLTEQRRLEREVLQISEDERQRFGRELHDNLGQQLTAIELMSHTLARELKAKKAPALAKSAQEIAEFTRQTVAQARQLAHGVAPVALSADGLMAALNNLARITARTGVACELEQGSPVYVHDPAAATHLYRIAQEAVHNALKHAKAKKIALRLSENERAVDLTIEDNGGGLRGNHSSGMGLQVIHHRARLIGAHVEITSAPGQGVKILCSLPKQS